MKNKYGSFLKLNGISIIAIFLLLTVSLQAIEYKDYKRKKDYNEVFELIVDDDNIEVFIFGKDQRFIYSVRKTQVSHNNNEVTIGDRLIFSKDKIIIDDTQLNYNDIPVIQTDGNDDYFSITFYTHKEEPGRSKRFRDGNIFEFNKKIKVEDNDFVRGYIFSVNGDIEVCGEVDKDIISLFGTVYAGSDAVIRGNIVTLDSHIDLAKNASVYGEIFSGRKQKSAGKHYFYRDDNELSFSLGFDYNKVDGLASYAGIEYKDLDSLLPKFWLNGGYGFASDRTRYSVGLEQPILKSMPLSIGGEMYRSLVSDDDWLLNKAENFALAILAAEDFRDYYEAEGGTAFIKFSPVKNLELEGRYSYEQTNWLESHPGLWALFGSKKDFDDNFETVPLNYRSLARTEVDTTENGNVTVSFKYDNTDKDEPFKSSAWIVNGFYEKSDPDFNSDFDYTRYRATVTRSQKINRRAMIILSGTYGASDGYLPVYKQFYLGGLGTLRGYNHKEYMGTRFLMASAEYRFNFPGSDIGASVFWDGGRITSQRHFTDADEVKHNLGIGLFFGDDVSISIAKRLDGIDHNEIKTLVRLTHTF